ncbi:MAG: hypothetical protein PVI30_23770 [Myxococcales bacterium]|jgi:triacylglycerol lipase
MRSVVKYSWLSLALGLWLLGCGSGSGEGDSGQGVAGTDGFGTTPTAPLGGSVPQGTATPTGDGSATGTGAGAGGTSTPTTTTPPATGTDGTGGAAGAGAQPPVADTGGGETTRPPATGDGTGAGSGGNGSTIFGPDPTSASASAPGTFQVESYTSGYEDSPAYLDATIWYPADNPGPFGGVAVVPGFVSPQSSIAPWGAFLASHGFVVITIGTNSGGDPPEVRAEALLAALGTLESENARSGGPVEGLVDTDRFALMGWSMGGGGTLIAANDNPQLKAAIPLAAWRPGGTFPNNKVPTLLFAGDTDPLAGGQSPGFYASIPGSTPKMLIEVVTGDHWLFNDPANLNGEVGRFGLSWLKVFVDGDDRYREFIEAMPTMPLASFERSL